MIKKFSLLFLCVALLLSGCAFGGVSISLDKHEYTVQVGESVQLSAATHPTFAFVEWKSEDESIVSVDKNGKISALWPGTAQVISSADGAVNEAVCTVTVPVPENLSFHVGVYENARLTPGGKAHMYSNNAAEFPWEDFISQTWKSSDESIASINPVSGEIIAPGKAGTATITLEREMKQGTLTAVAQVTVVSGSNSMLIEKIGLLSNTGEYYDIPLEKLYKTETGEPVISVPPGLYTFAISAIYDDAYFEIKQATMANPKPLYDYNLFKENLNYFFVLSSDNYGGHEYMITIDCRPA
jgi:hypothetical protein